MQSSASDTTAYVFKNTLHMKDILSTTLKLIRNNFLKLFLFSIIINVLQGFIFHYGIDATQPDFLNTTYMFVSFSLNIFMQGFFACATFLALRQEPSGIGICFGRTLRRMPAMMLAYILMMIGFGLGSLLFIIPGIIFLCAWYITLPICVIEGLGPIKSLSRSWALTKGYRLVVFAFVVVFFIGMFVLIAAFTALLPAGLAIIATYLAMVVMSVLDCVVRTVLYAMMRFIKEGSIALPGQGAGQPA